METDEELLDEETWAAWLEPREAIRRLVGLDIEDKEQAINWLKGRLADGAVRAAGWDSEYSPGNIIKVYDQRFWRSVGLIDWRDDFWISGSHQPRHMPNPRDFEDFIKPGFFSTTDRVRFDPAPISAFCERALPPGQATPSGLPAVRRGGRPPKPFWDRLWADVAAQLYNGDLQPVRQGDIESAMHVWVALNAENAGETAIREKAKLLWAAINKEVEN